MNTGLLQSAAFSLVIPAILWAAERRGGRGLVGLQRLALLLLLALPALVWLPKWHILPVAAAAPAVADGALAAGGAVVWAGLWLAGVLWVAVRLVRSQLLLGRLRRASRPLLEPADLALAAACGARVGLRRGVELRCSLGLRGPAACGIRRPLVLLPPAWRQWDRETKRAVLLHEMSHHLCRDPLWRAVALWATALYWFNPLVWWLAARLRSHAEFACDARVVGCGIRAERYAHILCDLAGEAPAPALAMAAPGSLEQRVRMLQRRRGASAPLWFGLAALALATCALAVAIVRPGAPQAPSPLPPGPSAAPYTAEEITTRQTANPFPADD